MKDDDMAFVSGGPLGGVFRDVPSRISARSGSPPGMHAKGCVQHDERFVSTRLAEVLTKSGGLEGICFSGFLLMMEGFVVDLARRILNCVSSH